MCLVSSACFYCLSSYLLSHFSISGGGGGSGLACVFAMERKREKMCLLVFPAHFVRFASEMRKALRTRREMASFNWQFTKTQKTSRTKKMEWDGMGRFVLAGSFVWCFAPFFFFLSIKRWKGLSYLKFELISAFFLLFLTSVLYILIFFTTMHLFSHLALIRANHKPTHTHTHTHTNWLLRTYANTAVQAN